MKVLKLKILILFLIIIISTNSWGCPWRRGKDKQVGNSKGVIVIINAPSALTATVISSSRINLSWIDNSSNEDGFEIESSLNGTDYLLLNIVYSNITSYSDTALSPTTNYYYHIRAFNIFGDKSLYSNEVSATTPGEWALITAGGYHTIGRKANGTLWGWGQNDWFQLGLGDTNNRIIPTSISIETDWLSFASGYNHNIAIKTDGISALPSGRLWGWGQNLYGQLGFGNTIDDGDIPYQIGSDTDYDVIATGYTHTLAIKNNGIIQTWGANDFGQLGFGDTNSRITPSQLGTYSDWSKIVAGLNDSLAIKTDRSLWSWGQNNSGQLGHGDITDRYTPTQIGTESEWIAIIAGYSHNIALKIDQTIWAWGYNASGQLGVGGYTIRKTPSQIGNDSDWSLIAAGYSHTIAIKTNNTIWGWGRNNYGQLGLVGTNNRTAPTQIGNDSEWTNIATGDSHTIALKNNGTIWSWGYNNTGQLGLGDTINRTTPTQIGISNQIPPYPPSFLAAMVASLSQINLSWIDNSNNEDGFIIERSLNGTDYLLLTTVYSNITSYPDTALLPATTYYYRVKAYNTYGDSSYSNEASIAISVNWFSIAAGYYHSIGLNTNGTLWAWGRNNYGQLGLGDTINRNMPFLIRTDSDWSIVTAGSNHTSGLKNNGTIWSWGRNNAGQLGMGLSDTNDRYTPTQVGTNSDWVTVVAAGGYDYGHTIAIKNDGTIWSWGYNNWGQLGVGNTINRTTPSLIGVSSDWLAVTAGESYTIALKTNKTIWSWGENSYGQLGLGTSGSSTNKTTPCQVGTVSDWSVAVAGGYHTLVQKTNGTIWTWGYNGYGQLGLGDSSPLTSRSTPTQIGNDSDWFTVAAGYTYSLARKTNGILWAWGGGNPNYGQLGLGDQINRNTPTQVGTDSDWSMFEGGYAHTIAIKANELIWAWGANSYGQLGLGITGNKNLPTSMGR